MTNKDAIEKLGYIKNQYHVMLNFTDYDEVFDIAIKALENERKTGHWIPIAPDSRGYTEAFECSNCNNRVKYSYCMKESEYPICPNCGAQMKGGAE